MRSIPSVLLIVVAGCSAGPQSIVGSARLPDCSDAPAADVSGRWFDQGEVTITSAGCEAQGAPQGATFASCALDWELSQKGNDVTISVDGEYQLRGRLCGATLHLEGGWWLPLQDEQGQCNYDDDDGDEVGIEAGGNTLVLEDDDGAPSLVGELFLRGKCLASYEARFRRTPQL